MWKLLKLFIFITLIVIIVISIYTIFFDLKPMTNLLIINVPLK